MVNEARKTVAQLAPDLSKRLRTLIKCWQKIAEPGTASSASSSTNGTPNLVSPGALKSLTPGTPGSRLRLTPGSTGTSFSEICVPGLKKILIAHHLCLCNELPNVNSGWYDLWKPVEKGCILGSEALRNSVWEESLLC